MRRRFPLKGAECKQKAYRLHRRRYAENTVINCNSSSKEGINVPRRCNCAYAQRLSFHELPRLSIPEVGLTISSPSIGVIAPLLRVDISALLSPLRRQKGRCSVMERCLCLPVKANGSKHWFCFSTPVSEWQPHLCINKLRAARQCHLYRSL